jgi:hypothetical protein
MLLINDYTTLFTTIDEIIATTTTTPTPTSTKNNLILYYTNDDEYSKGNRWFLELKRSKYCLDPIPLV